MTALDDNVKGRFEKYILTETDKADLRLTHDEILNGVSYLSSIDRNEIDSCGVELDNFIGINEMLSIGV